MKISRDTLESLVLASKNTYPNEFFAMLGSSKKDGTVDEFVIVPSVYGKEHTLIRLDLKPIDPKIIGSMHSHPSYSNRPSRQDLSTFKKLGKFHLIISHPFQFENIAAYNANGKTIGIKVVD